MVDYIYPQSLTNRSTPCNTCMAGSAKVYNGEYNVRRCLVRECVPSKLGHTEPGSRFKVSSERPEQVGIDLAIPRLVHEVQCIVHYTAAPCLADCPCHKQ